MKFIPRSYQELIIDHIINVPRCNVWAGMGMGKTVSTLTALEIADALEDVFPALIVAPKRVALTVWPNEIRKWEHLEHLSCSVLIGTPKQREAALLRDAQVYTINYENLPWLIDQGDWKFKSIICDESSKLKSFRTRIKRNAEGKMPRKPSRALATVAFKSERFVCLTGTPSPNGLQDLWGQAWYLDKGERLGASFTKYTNKYFKSISYGAFKKIAPHDGTEEEVISKLRDLTLSVQPEDYFDIDQPVSTKIEIELPSKASKLYKQMEREFFVEIQDNEAEAVNAAVKSAKCLQIASGFVYDDDGNAQVIHDQKIEALKSLVNELDEPLLVAYHWETDKQELLKAFPKAEVLSSDPTVLERWNKGEINMLLAHPASAGHGLNLQDGGRALCFYSNWWSLEEHQQIVERIGPVRQKQSGYDRSVLIYHIIAKGTLDNAVLERLETKASVQDILLKKV